jgi:hypothetical protein
MLQFLRYLITLQRDVTVFALSHNALTLLRTVITGIIYSYGLIGNTIASFGYCSKHIDQRYCFYSLSLVSFYLSAFQSLHFLRQKMFNIYFFQVLQNSIKNRRRLACNIIVTMLFYNMHRLITLLLVYKIYCF